MTTEIIQMSRSNLGREIVCLCKAADIEVPKNRAMGYLRRAGLRCGRVAHHRRGCASLLRDVVDLEPAVSPESRRAVHLDGLGMHQRVIIVGDSTHGPTLWWHRHRR